MEQQHNQGFWDEAEQELRKAGEATVVDFFRELMPNEYELEYLRHQQEGQNIAQKLKYRLTIDGKKKVLNDELEQTIAYLEDEEEGEFRQLFGDLSQVTLDKVIDKIKSMASLIQKSSLWNELEHKQKVLFIAIRNLPSNFIKPDVPFREAYREILRRLNIRILTEKDKKSKPTTINRQFKEFANRLFYDHFQVEMNKVLQEELKKFLDPSEFKIKKELFQELDSDKYVIIPIKIKGVKKGKEIDLEQDHYTILTHYFQKARVFLSDDSHISDTSASKAMQILSGYHYDNIRKKLGSLDFSNDQKAVVREKLEEVILLIDKDLNKKKMPRKS